MTVSIFKFDELATVEPTVIANMLANLTCKDLSAEIVVFLICRNYRLPLVNRIFCADSDERREWAGLINDALLHVFINGDWDQPDLQRASRYDSRPRLWPGTIGPISVSMAEMALFLGNVARHCPGLWSWEDERPFIARFLENDYHLSMFRQGEQEEELIS